MKDGGICPVVRPEGGSSSMTCVGKLAQQEQASNAQRRARGHRGKRKTERRYARWHPRTFSNTFSCQGEWASVVKGATGHRPCPQQHRSRNASQALLEVHRSASVCVCVRNTPYGSVHLQVIITTAWITCMIKRTSTPALGHDLNVTSVLPTEFFFIYLVFPVLTSTNHSEHQSNLFEIAQHKHN